MRQWLALCLLLAPGKALPKFEVKWEYKGSYLYNEDKLHNKWTGTLQQYMQGYLYTFDKLALWFVTIHTADVCTVGGQELYLDTFSQTVIPG